MAQTQDALWSHGNQETIDHTPGGDIAAGELVFFGSGLEVLVAVALRAMTNGQYSVGALCITGIFKVKKKSGETFSTGDLVGWDATPGEAVPAGDGGLTQQLGMCVADAGATDDFVLTKINFGGGWEASGA